jgi:hypothetical protein
MRGSLAGRPETGTQHKVTNKLLPRCAAPRPALLLFDWLLHRIKCPLLALAEIH